MQLTNTPGKLVLPFANVGAKNTIPTASQIGITAGAASLTDGFPPLTRTPIAAGGVPPSGLDMNGILYELSAILRWANAGGGYAYDSTFANDSNVNGYPKGARIMRSDGLGYWFNTVENNTTDPEAAGAAAAGWVPDFTNGVTSVAMASANVTLTPLQYGKPIIVITGTLTANLNLIFPTIVNEWTVINNTTGPYTITCKTAAGTGVIVNSAQAIVGDGTKIYSAVKDNAGNAGLFKKADSTTVAFTKTGAFTVSTSQAITVEVNGVVQNIAAATVVTMPGAPASGTDYAVWAKPGGTLEATSNHTSPPVANSRKIGGFHYAPGGNAAAQAGGNTTPQINEYSFWDLKFRPAAIDPRGMTLVAGGFWADIYFTGVDHLTNGTSKYNVTIADGSSPPKIPTKFGGNGTSAYSSMNWWEAAEVLKSHGKRLPTYSEFSALAYGSTEASSVGTDQASTILNAAYTSRWGVIQATGVLWTWGDEFSYNQDGAATPWNWRAVSGGRGSLYLYSDIALVAALFGGAWYHGSYSGSRCSDWNNYPWISHNGIGARGVSDHLQLD